MKKIGYEIEDIDGTIFRSLTKCPYKVYEYSDGHGSIRHVGALPCEKCDYHKYMDKQEQYVKCSYEDKNE